jgi:hypothetical protein
VSERAGHAVVLDGGVTKSADLFVAWRYVAAVPRLPKNFLQPFPGYGWCGRDPRITRPKAEQPDSVAQKSESNSIAYEADLR